MNIENKPLTPYFLAGLIVTFILFLAWSARQASTGGTDVTDPDYYSKGLKYNSTLIEKRAASVIGWAVRAELTPGKLALHLTDKDDGPVVNATGTATFPEPGGNRVRVFALQEFNPGTYLLALPQELTGERLARIDFEHGGARISRQLMLNIPERNFAPGNQH